MNLELDESNGKIENDISELHLNENNILASNKIPTEETFDNIDLRIEKEVV